MFCPNCGGKSSAEQKYCRSCGLALEKIVETLAEQLPAHVDAKIRKRRETFELIGFGGLLMLAVPLLGMLFYKTVYKWIILGGNVLAGVIATCIIVGGILAVIFFNYANHLEKQE